MRMAKPLASGATPLLSRMRPSPFVCRLQPALQHRHATSARSHSLDLLEKLNRAEVEHLGQLREVVLSQEVELLFVAITDTATLR